MSYYLEKFIQSVVDTKHENEIIIIKNANLQYCYASESIVKSHGFKNLSSMEGSNIYDVNTPIRYAADDLQQEELTCIEHKTVTKSIFFESRSVSQLYSEKHPIINPLTNETVGLIMQIKLVMEPFCYRKVLGTLINNFNSSKILFDKRYSTLKNIKLTKREKMVLFLCILNFDLEKIAQIVSNFELKSIGVNLIRNNINQQLYNKFDVSNIADLVDKAISIGYHNYIPPGFTYNFRIDS